MDWIDLIVELVTNIFAFGDCSQLRELQEREKEGKDDGKQRKSK